VRMQPKVFWSGALYLLGPFIILGLLGVNPVTVTFLMFWFPIFALGQFWWFRCPHCAKTAVLRPWGGASPFVGDRCAYCGKDY
jgi:hypothetical protein